MATPQTFTMASRPATYPSLWSRPPHQLWGRILLTDPCPPGLGPVCRLRGFATGSLSLHLLVSIAGPRPSGSPSLSRRCQGCSRPPRRLPDQASLIYTSLLRQAHSGVLSSPPGHMAPRGARRYRHKSQGLPTVLCMDLTPHLAGSSRARRGLLARGRASVIPWARLPGAQLWALTIQV